MAIFTNSSITDGGQFTFPVTNTYSRPGLITTVASFTTVGTTSWSAPTGVRTIEVLVVAGGGGGGGGFDTWAGAGGGGAGGVIYRSEYTVVPGNSYTVTVGDGGAGGTGSSPRTGTNGQNSVFDTLTAVGGGGGGGWQSAPNASNALSGGSGGGGANSSGGFLGAAGTAGQGFAGGNGMSYSGTNASSGGGGGGAGGVGGSPGGNTGGGGGYGLWFNITGTAQVYAVGGGGGGGVTGGGAGPGLPGTGGRGGNGTGSSGTAGTSNTGSGGGGGGSTANPNATTNGGKGGSGIVVIRYTIATDNTNPIGQIRYNKDASDIEVYDNPLVGWVAQDQTKNFAGHNLVTYSEQADNAAWTKSAATISANSIAAPDGTLTADKIVETTAANTNHYILQGFTVPANSVWCASVFVKAAGRSRLRIAFSTYNSWVGGGGCETQYDLSTQTITPKSSTPTGYGIADAGNGWYRVYLTGTNNNSATGSNFVIYTENATDYVYTGDGSSGIYVWGMQLERDVFTPGPYTRTVDGISPLPGASNGWRIHTYTSTGTSSFAPALTGNVELLVVGGGGSCGVDVGGGGGAGGVVYHQNYPVESGKIYTVTVAAGVGAGNRTSGNNSQFGNVLALGGGAAGWYYDRQGYSGGSGGGAGGGGPNSSARLSSSAQYPGEGTQGQGHRGGFRLGGAIGGGGGGGAGGPGEDQYGYGARGGPGVAYEITGKLTWYGGGGGSGDSGGVAQIGYGGIGGGGDGDSRNNSSANIRPNGMPNTGGGGGGDGGWVQPGGGGSGIVVVRYRYNN